MLGRSCRVYLAGAAILGLVATSTAAGDELRDALWAAVRTGDTEAVQAALDRGADVNSKNEMGVSALWIAASRGKFDVIQCLVERGADVNVRDGIWYQTPLSNAVVGLRLEAAQLLIKEARRMWTRPCSTAASRGNEAMVGMIIEHGKLSQDALDAALYTAATAKNEKLEEALKKAGQTLFPRRPNRTASCGRNL